MERITDYKYIDLIQEAYSCIPDHILSHLPTIHFFTGTDVVYAGLELPEKSKDGRLFKDNIHYNPSCAFKGKFIVRDNPTIVIPSSIPGFCYYKDHVIHEIGHIIDDELLDSDWTFNPVTEYAKKDESEAFAEAFVYYCIYGYEDFEISKSLDNEINEFFNRLWKW
jgi:hypothetical protein